MSDYRPQPIDTSGVQLGADIERLAERLAENAHDVWAAQRLADGWQYGPQRDDAKLQHPCLVAYAKLPEAEKQYDRNAVLETLKAIKALGFLIGMGVD